MTGVEKDKLIDLLFARLEDDRSAFAEFESMFYGSAKMAGIASAYRTLISTCRLMKVSVSEYFRKVFRMIVAGYDNLTSLLPMNMELAVNNY